MIYLDSLIRLNAWPMDLCMTIAHRTPPLRPVGSLRSTGTVDHLVVPYAIRTTISYPEGELGPNLAGRQSRMMSDPDLPRTVPVHCRSVTWNQLLGGVQPEPDRVAIVVAVHKELDIDIACGSQYDIKTNKTKARKRSTVTEFSLDAVWIPTGIDAVRMVLVWFLTIPFLKPKQLSVPDLLANFLKPRRLYSDQTKRLELVEFRSETECKQANNELQIRVFGSAPWATILMGRNMSVVGFVTLSVMK